MNDCKVILTLRELENSYSGHTFRACVLLFISWVIYHLDEYLLGIVPTIYHIVLKNDFLQLSQETNPFFLSSAYARSLMDR